MSWNDPSVKAHPAWHSAQRPFPAKIAKPRLAAGLIGRGVAVSPAVEGGRRGHDAADEARQGHADLVLGDLARPERIGERGDVGGIPPQAAEDRVDRHVHVRGRRHGEERHRLDVLEAPDPSVTIEEADVEERRRPEHERMRPLALCQGAVGRSRSPPADGNRSTRACAIPTAADRRTAFRPIATPDPHRPKDRRRGARADDDRRPWRSPR